MLPRSIRRLLSFGRSRLDSGMCINTVVSRSGNTLRAASRTGVAGRAFAAGVAVFTASTCTARAWYSEDSSGDSDLKSSKTDAASLEAPRKISMCVSSPAEGTPASGAEPGWWAKLIGSSSSPPPANSQWFDEKSVAHATSQQETEGWWAWASERLAAQKPPLPPVEVPLPLDKLSCKMQKEGQKGDRPPVVLLSCGSFNPPTIAHLRMFELAYDALTEQGYDVLGGYMSPVNDAYGKPDLAQAEHRVQMAELAAESSRIIMVDTWEAEQPAWQRTLSVMMRLRNSLAAELAPQQAPLFVASHPTSSDSKAESHASLDSTTADAVDFPGSQGARGASGASLSPATSDAPEAAGELPTELPTVGSYTCHSAHAAWASPHAAPSAGGTLAKDRTLAEERALKKGSSSVLAAAASAAPAGKGPAKKVSHSPGQVKQAWTAAGGQPSSVQAVPRVLLLCGADLVESFTTPGVWQAEHLAQIVGPDHGVVCIARRGSDVRRMVADSRGTLNGSSAVQLDLAKGITVVEDPVSWDVSSTRVRALLQQGKSVKYLIPDGVLDYIKLHGLYVASKA